MADYLFNTSNVYNGNLLTISVGSGSDDTNINCNLLKSSSLNYNFKKVTDALAGTITLTFSNNENFTDVIYNDTKEKIWTINIDGVALFKGLLDRQSFVSKINDGSTLEKGSFSLRLAGVDISDKLTDSASDVSVADYITNIVDAVSEETVVFQDDIFITLSTTETCHMNDSDAGVDDFYFNVSGDQTDLKNQVKTLRKMFNFNMVSWNGNLHVFSRRLSSSPVILSSDDFLNYQSIREFTSDNFSTIYSSEDYRLIDIDEEKVNRIQVFDNDIIIADKNHINSWDDDDVDWRDRFGATTRNNYNDDAYNIVTSSNNPAILSINFHISDTAFGVYDRIDVINLGETMFVSFMIHDVTNFFNSTAYFIYGWISAGRVIIDFTSQINPTSGGKQMIYLSFDNENYDRSYVESFSTNIIAIEIIKGSFVGSNNISFGLSDVWIGRSTKNEFNQKVNEQIVSDSPFVDIVSGGDSTVTVKRQAEFKYRLLNKINTDNRLNEGVEFKKHIELTTKQSVNPYDLVSIDSVTYRILKFDYNFLKNTTTLELLEN